MFHKTAADMGSLAASALHLNALTTENAQAARAYNDPSSLSDALSTYKSAIGGVVDSSPTISAEVGARVKSELMFKAEENLVKAAISGAITKGGDWQSIASKYPQYVNQAELVQFDKAAKVQQRADTLQQKQIDTYKRAQDDQAVHAESNRIMTDNVTIDPQNNLPLIKPEFFTQALDIAKRYPDAPNAAATAKTLLNWGEMQQKKREPTRQQSDPTALRDLTDRMFDPDNPTSKIDLMRAQVEGKVSQKDFTPMNRLLTELERSPVRGQVWRDTMNAVKSRLMPPLSALLGPDPKGVQDYAAFVQTFMPQYLQASRSPSGAPPGALDLKNPESMISKTLAQFEGHATFQDRFGSSALPALPQRPAAQPRLPGESIADWERRKGAP